MPPKSKRRPELEPAGEDDAGSPLVRTHTDRTAARSDDLDGLSVTLESIEERFRNIEDVPLASTQKVLMGLQMQLQQLDGKLDEIGVRGLTGESPLRSRKRSMLERCDRLQTDVGTKLQAVQEPQQTPPEPEPELEPEPEPEPADAIPEGQPPDVKLQSVSALLHAARCSDYLEAIRAADYEELSDLLEADGDEIEELIANVQMGKPAARRFRKGIAAAAVTTAAESSTKGLAASSGHEDDAHDGVHSSGFCSDSAEGSIATVFGSMRFPVPPEARALQSALRQRGVDLQIIDMRAGDDISEAVFTGIREADAVVVFGTADYGEKTSNPACTYFEAAYAQNKKKQMILLRMIPWEEDYQHIKADQLFNLNMLTLSWLPGTPMPDGLDTQVAHAAVKARR